jgi:NitT/TauT family transport system ATP-binding protein
MQTELVRLRRETGATVVFVTHSIPEAVFLSDRVVVMSPRPGRITHLIGIPLEARTEDARETARFYGSVTAVREALRGRSVDVGGAAAAVESAGVESAQPRGVDLR